MAGPIMIGDGTRNARGTVRFTGSTRRPASRRSSGGCGCGKR